MHKDTLLNKIIRNSFFLQNLALKLTNYRNITVHHNLEKMMTLNKIFYYIAYEEIKGDYFEFGLFQGTSFIAAMRAFKKYKKNQSIERNFFGFDSFSGIGKLDEDDIHPTYKTGLFKTNKNIIKNRIKKNATKLNININLTEGYVEDTIKGKTSHDDKNSKICAVCMLDMDMKVPTKIALNYIKDSLQIGSIIIFDEYHSYKGKHNKGEKGAFNEFLKENPKLIFDEFINYGLDGKSFILSDIK
jgi:O-methyltransferase